MEGTNSFEKTERKESSENPDEFFEEVLRTSPIIASGRDGIILKIDLAKFDPSTVQMMQNNGIQISAEDGYALKVLKIYRPGEGKREYDAQMEAYELLKDVSNTAKIPKPIVVRAQHLSETDKQYLNKYNIFLGNDAEVILMDFIEGKDLANYVYDFVLSKYGYDNYAVQNMSFEQKHETISGLLNFRIPKNSMAGDFRDVINRRDNVKKLMNYLKKSDFHLDQGILDQIKEALKTLGENKIFHNDLHERNLMIGSDGIPYIIDFGRTVRDKSKHHYDDFAVVRRFEDLNKEKEIGSNNSEYWHDLADRISKSKKWKVTLKKWEESIRNENIDAVFNNILSESAEESRLEQSLAALAHLLEILGSEYKPKIIEVANNLQNSVVAEYAKRKVGDFIGHIGQI